MHVKSLEIRKNISLSHFNTWNIGGPAELIAEPKTILEIKNLMSWVKQKNLTCTIIGAGSNILISDQGLTGLTLCTRQLRGCKLNSITGVIEALSGEPLPALSRRAAKAGLHGLEWAVGIPGTIGGAVTMNAGAAGNCISEKIQSIKVLSITKGKQYELLKSELDFDYRKSLLQQEDLILLSAKFKLEAGHDKRKLNEITNAHISHRMRNQPYKQHTCGSVFRNPEPYKAAKLIEELGLKGLRIGGAEISKIHSNFIINTDNASSDDIQNLISIIQQKVEESYGILLKPEVKSYGFQINS